MRLQSVLRYSFGVSQRHANEIVSDVQMCCLTCHHALQCCSAFSQTSQRRAFSCSEFILGAISVRDAGRVLWRAGELSHVRKSAGRRILCNWQRNRYGGDSSAWHQCHCWAPFVKPHNLQNVLRSFEIPHAQFASFWPKPYPNDQPWGLGPYQPQTTSAHPHWPLHKPVYVIYTKADAETVWMSRAIDWFVLSTDSAAPLIDPLMAQQSVDGAVLSTDPIWCWSKSSHLFLVLQL